jgi:Ni,Fe-hydrogenase I cytochrome b subunit
MSLLYFLADIAPKIDPGKSGVNIPTVTATQLLNSALNLTYFVAGIVAIVVIIIAGYDFTTAVYDPAKITQAKNNVLYAVVGLVVVIFAFVITQFIMRKF